jgi:hypothetical protein
MLIEEQEDAAASHMRPGRQTGDINQRIRAELARVCSLGEALTWLASPQKMLTGRVPSRMIAIGEGLEVLRVLKALTTRSPAGPVIQDSPAASADEERLFSVECESRSSRHARITKDLPAH